MASVLFGYGGPLGEPEVFRAIVGEEGPARQVVVRGVKLVFQPFELIKSTYIRGELKRSWGDKFYGAFGLCPVPDREKITLITLYNVGKKLHPQVTAGLVKFNFHGQGGWFEFEKMSCTTADGTVVEFWTERLTEDGKLEEAREGFREDLEYKRFWKQMADKAREESRRPEGQQSGSPERS